VLIDSNGQLSTVSSSRRYKEDIQNMGDASSGLMQLRPVTFRYRKPFAKVPGLSFPFCAQRCPAAGWDEAGGAQSAARCDHHRLRTKDSDCELVYEAHSKDYSSRPTLDPICLVGLAVVNGVAFEDMLLRLGW
jgi:hypothetical protein